MNRKYSWIAVGALAVLALLVLIGSRFHIHRGYFGEDKVQTANAISQFHTHLNERAFDKIYDDADESLKQSTSREEWKQMLQDVFTHTGKFGQVKDSELNVIMGAPIQIRGAFRSSFERGNFTELFAFIRRDENIRLAYYAAFQGSDNDVKHGTPEKH